MTYYLFKCTQHLLDCPLSFTGQEKHGKSKELGKVSKRGSVLFYLLSSNPETRAFLTIAVHVALLPELECQFRSKTIPLLFITLTSFVSKEIY